MAIFSRLALLALAAGACAGALQGQESIEAPAAPALVTSPMLFIGITPCRIGDTPPDYGQPK